MITQQEKNATFERVYDALISDIYAYFNICFGAEAAEDLTQEIFLRVWKAIDAEQPPDNWRAWVFRCAVNLKNDYLRRAYLARGAQEHFIKNAEPSASDDMQNLCVRLAFDALDRDTRELLTLKNLGFKSEEIGALLGVSASAVRTRLQKAKQSFAEKLETEVL